MFLHFIIEERFKLLSALEVFGIGRVVDSAVSENSVHVSFKEMLCYVVSKIGLEYLENSPVSPKHYTYLFLIRSPIDFRSIGYLMCS